MIQKISVWLVMLVIITGAVFVETLSPVFAAPAPNSDTTIATNAWGGCWYVVRPGDNLYRISIRHGVSYWYLAQINGLYNPHYIYAGQTLSVPCGNYYPPPYPPRPRQPCAPSQTYIVKPHDNVFRIALNYGTTIVAIRNANYLWGRVLRPNMRLIIPCPGSVPYANQTPVAPPPTAVPPTRIPPTAVPPTQVPGNADVTVALQDASLQPNPVDIKAGQTVMWVNNSQNTYTLLSGIPGQPNNVFASPPLPPGGTFTFKFVTGGNYSYYVNENVTMIGQVNVSP